MGTPPRHHLEALVGGALDAHMLRFMAKVVLVSPARWVWDCNYWLFCPDGCMAKGSRRCMRFFVFGRAPGPNAERHSRQRPAQKQGDDAAGTSTAVCVFFVFFLHQTNRAFCSTL